MTTDKHHKEYEEEAIDDVVFEETAEGEGEALSKDKIKKLRDDLKTAQAEKTDYLTNWQKERADFINYKKGEDERKKQTLDFAREQFVEELLPVLDAYDIAFSNKEAWEKVEKNWRMGVEYIHQQLLKVLLDNGVTEVSPTVGDAIDANLHDGIDTVETDDESKDGTVAVIMQKGYKMKDRVLRPARVKVFQKK
ncbi:MAG: nucleotide exchange factor GrpE [Candidatus Pacebacteria bacterium]|nr:nucleotide exchange factor GrpE [Candidatus Paceibacterota bacterium]